MPWCGWGRRLVFVPHARVTIGQLLFALRGAPGLRAKCAVLVRLGVPLTERSARPPTHIIASPIASPTLVISSPAPHHHVPPAMPRTRRDDRVQRSRPTTPRAP